MAEKFRRVFFGGDVSGDGRIIAPRAAERLTEQCEALDAVLEDPRDPNLITYHQFDMLRQRIDGLALG